MKRFSIFILLFFAFVSGAGAGTGVGNFSFKNQFQFDFRIGFPPKWKWSEVATSDPGEVERWVLTNKVGDSTRASSAVVSFLGGFPAANDEELLTEIKRRHPTLAWKPLREEAPANPDFVGFVSDQEFIGTDRTRSYQYYFSERHKVIRIEATRDKAENGATDLDMILATIRRPSGMPKVVSIKSPESEKSKVKVGDKVCYLIEVDVLKSDFGIDSLNGFKVKGAHDHWSFNDVKWNKKDTSFEVCVPVNARFGADGLVIKSLGLTTTGPSLSCVNATENGDTKLSCGGSANDVIRYKVPVVDNPNPAIKSPRFTKIEIGSRPSSVRLGFESSVPLSIGELILESSSDGKSNDSQIIYEDQLRGSGVEVFFDEKRLPRGFTRVTKIMLADQVGNVGVLTAELGKPKYTLFTSDSKPQPTEIPVISLKGGQR